MTLRTRLIAAFLASTLLPLVATVWITTTLLDRSLRYATTGELDRLSRTLETTAKQFYQRERDALKQDALAGRTPSDDATDGARRRDGPNPSDRSGRAARPNDSACRAPAASAWNTCVGGRPRRPDRRRDLQPRPRRRQHGAVVHPGPRDAPTGGRDRRARSAARIHADVARAAGRGMARLAPAAGADRAPGQPADPAAHGGADRFRRRRLVAAAGRPAATGARRRATRSAAPSRRSTTWPINSRRTASGSCT